MGTIQFGVARTVNSKRPGSRIHLQKDLRPAATECLIMVRLLDPAHMSMFHRGSSQLMELSRQELEFEVGAKCNPMAIRL